MEWKGVWRRQLARSTEFSTLNEIIMDFVGKLPEIRFIDAGGLRAIVAMI